MFKHVFLALVCFSGLLLAQAPKNTPDPSPWQNAELAEGQKTTIVVGKTRIVAHNEGKKLKLDVQISSLDEDELEDTGPSIRIVPYSINPRTGLKAPDTSRSVEIPYGKPFQVPPLPSRVETRLGTLEIEENTSIKMQIDKPESPDGPYRVDMNVSGGNLEFSFGNDTTIGAFQTTNDQGESVWRVSVRLAIRPYIPEGSSQSFYVEIRDVVSPGASVPKK